MTGAELVRAERKRQVEVEGWTAEHDDAHWQGEMARAASCYLNADGPDAERSNLWPWDPKWWKPKDRRSNLVRAGALYLAEIERIERKGHRVSMHLRVLVRGIEAMLDDLPGH